MIGTLVKQTVFADVNNRSGIRVTAEDLFETHIKQVSLGGKEGTVARVVGNSNSKTVECIIPQDVF